ARGPRIIPLAGRLWRLEAVYWERREVLVSAEPEGSPSGLRWPGEPVAASYELCRAQRDVLLGENPPIELSLRARERLSRTRDELAYTVDESGLVFERKDGCSTLWTWAGQRANDTLLAALKLQHDGQSDNVSITMPSWSGRRNLIAA